MAFQKFFPRRERRPRQTETVSYRGQFWSTRPDRMDQSRAFGEREGLLLGTTADSLQSKSPKIHQIASTCRQDPLPSRPPQSMHVNSRMKQTYHPTFSTCLPTYIYSLKHEGPPAPLRSFFSQRFAEEKACETRPPLWALLWAFSLAPFSVDLKLQVLNPVGQADVSLMSPFTSKPVSTNLEHVS